MVVFGIKQDILRIKERGKTILGLMNFFPWRKTQNAQENCFPGSKMRLRLKSCVILFMVRLESAIPRLSASL
jgi:hypothetical protein